MKRKWMWLLLGLVGVVIFALSLRPTPVEVEVATVRRGTLAVTVSDQGRTRVRGTATWSPPRSPAAWCV